MAWCDACERYLTPSSLTAEGNCPSCGCLIEAPAVAPKAPWHFKLLVVALAVYLGWRAIQGVAWVIQHLA